MTRPVEGVETVRVGRKEHAGKVYYPVIFKVVGGDYPYQHVEVIGEDALKMFIKEAQDALAGKEREP